MDPGLALVMAPMRRPPPREEGRGWGWSKQKLLSSRTCCDDGNDLYLRCPRVAIEDLKRGVVRGTNCTEFCFI